MSMSATGFVDFSTNFFRWFLRLVSLQRRYGVPLLLINRVTSGFFMAGFAIKYIRQKRLH